LILRPARAADVAAFLEIKHELRLDPARPAEGGFLLGASADAYAWYVEHAHVLVLEGADGRIGGFAVALPDAVLRATDVWARRHQIAWDAGGWDALEGAKVGYFDQLAVRPERRGRIYAPALAAAVVQALAADGHQHVFATVVREPVWNTASLPLLHAAGARRIGQIDETYPEAGRILSDVYHLPIAPGTISDLLTSTPLGRRVATMLARAAPVAGRTTDSRN
jgi:ribosomal protein S18 acetylase RimI-like enzyme